MRVTSAKSIDMSVQVVEWRRLNSCTTSYTDPLTAIDSLSPAICTAIVINMALSLNRAYNIGSKFE